MEGVGHFEPLRHYAEVHLLLEPLPAGSGLVFDTQCSEDILERSWQRLILTHLQEKTHLGVLTGAPITAGLDGRLPSIASFTCNDVDGELLVVLLDRAGVAAATGSACSTGSTEPSHVLTAMGIDATTARGALRLSLASNVTDEDIALLSERIPTCIRKARLISSTR